MARVREGQFSKILGRPVSLAKRAKLEERMPWPDWWFDEIRMRGGSSLRLDDATVALTMNRVPARYVNAGDGSNEQ